MDAPSSPQISKMRKRRMTPGASAQLASIRLLGSAKGVAVRVEKARRRKFEENKIKEAEKQYFFERARDMSRSAMVAALGQTYVYKLGIDKKTMLVEDPQEIAHALDLIHDKTMHGFADGQYYFVTTTAPDMNAIDKIWQRMWGKAAESITIDATVKNFSLTGLARERSNLPLLDLGHVPSIGEAGPQQQLPPA